MGGGRAQLAQHVIQHIDVLESFVRQKVGSVSPDRIKILPGVGTSMPPLLGRLSFASAHQACHLLTIS